MTRKQSRSSKPSQTPEDQSQTPLMQQQDQLGKAAAIQNLLGDSSMLSDEQLNQAISTGYRLAMLDSLSMLQRKAARLRMSQSEQSMTSTTQQG